MTLEEVKALARDSYYNQRTQDNEGGHGQAIGHIYGYVEGYRNQESLILELEKEITRLATFAPKDLGHISYQEYIQDLEIRIQNKEKQLKEKDEQIEKMKCCGNCTGCDHAADYKTCCYWKLEDFKY